VPSAHEFILDLGLGSGARGALGESEVPGATGECLTAERPDTASARVESGSPPLEYRAEARVGAVPVQDPATSTGRGSFNSDRNHGYPHEWPTMEAFQEWRRSEERAHTIELRVAKVEYGAETLGRTLWTKKHVYRCARQRIRQKADQKKHPERQQKVLRKGTGCRCQIVIKSYPHTPIVLGRYLTDHNHELGADNMIYTRLSDGSRQQIKSMLIQKVDAGEIVST
jgi:hypothetical protein